MSVAERSRASLRLLTVSCDNYRCHDRDLCRGDNLHPNAKVTVSFTVESKRARRVQVVGELQANSAEAIAVASRVASNKA